MKVPSASRRCNFCTATEGTATAFFFGSQADYGTATNIFQTRTGGMTLAAAVPGPVAGAGLPGLITALVGLLGWMRRLSSAYGTFEV